MISSDVADAAGVILVRPALGGLQGRYLLICCCRPSMAFTGNLARLACPVKRRSWVGSVLVVSEWAMLQS